MKKCVILLIVVTALSTLFSCGVKYTDTRDPVYAFLEAYQVDARVYYSLAAEGEEEYAGNDLCKLLYANNDILPRNYTVAMHSRLDSVFELGVFLAPAESDAIELCELCLERISLLSSLASGEGRVFRRGDLVIYIFDESIEQAAKALDKVL